MSSRLSTAALLVLVALVAFAPIAGVAGAAGAVQAGQEDSSDERTETANASTGAQLGTVIQVTDETVRHEVEVASFEAALDEDNETARAQAIARHAAELRERAASIRAEYESATRAAESGELSRPAYAQRLAVLHARATTALNGFDRVEAAAERTASVELAAAGYNASANEEAYDSLSAITGRGTGALLAQFTGQTRGEFSVETENGLVIEAESEDGERSREYERAEPEHGTFDVSRTEARATAEAALTAPEANASWVLQSVERDSDGYYAFDFAFDGETTTGEAAVSVDARSAAVFALEEEIERRDDDDDDRDELLAIDVIDGEPEPGATVTIRVTDRSGEPVADADVRVDYEHAGTTDAEGTLQLAIPNTDDVSIDAASGEAEGELDLEFDQEHDGDGAVAVDAGFADGTATVSATFQGEPISDAAVYVDDERVGQTDANGTVAFDAAAGEDYDVDLVRGAFTVEFDVEISDAGEITTDEPEWEIEHDAAADDSDDSEESDDDSEDGSENEGDDSDDDSESAGSLALEVTEGDVERGGTVTVLVTDENGDPVAGATVEVDSDAVGQTGSDGTITVQLPDDDDATVEAETGDLGARLDLELGRDD